MAGLTKDDRDSIAWTSLLSQLESLIVAGDHEKCRELLGAQKPKDIPRQWAAQFADVAWRANDFLFALKSLQSLVYPDNPFLTPASLREKVIYGSSLASLGATHEAIRVLSEINGDEEPAVFFHLASAMIYDWDYESAIPYLQKYIGAKGVTPYRRLVGKVNWAAALIHLQNWPQATQLLEVIQRECEANGYQLLLGNCLELRAQIEIFQGRYGDARPLLRTALTHLKAQAGHYSMYVEKWLAVCGCLQAKMDAEKDHELKALAEVRRQAVALKHWNTIRECDLFTAIALNNHDLLKKVIMGTPSELYRQRARKLFGSQIISKGTFHLRLGPGPERSECARQFDPYQRTSTGDALFSKPLLFTLFQALTIDFYQPQTLGMLFQRIYPSEKFNPFTSPARVLQLLRRLNQWFETNELPLRVDFTKSEFQLTSTEGINVVIVRGDERTAKNARFSEVKEHFRDAKFTVTELCEKLQISKATAERLLRTALRDGVIRKERKSRGVTYRFAGRNQKRRAA